MKSTSKKIKIISCHGNLTAKSTAKILDTQTNYVYRIWALCGLKKIRKEQYILPYERN